MAEVLVGFCVQKLFLFRWSPFILFSPLPLVLPLCVAITPCGRKFTQLRVWLVFLCQKFELMIPFLITFLISLGAFFRSR